MHIEKGLSLGYFQDIFLKVIPSCTLCHSGGWGCYGGGGLDCVVLKCVVSESTRSYDPSPDQKFSTRIPITCGG